LGNKKLPEKKSSCCKPFHFVLRNWRLKLDRGKTLSTPAQSNYFSGRKH